MKFVVSSTSGGYRKQPCDEAIRGSIERENKIYSDANADVWFVEINTLEELIKFYEENGDIIIKDFFWNKSYTEIEIYDDYRE